MTDEELNRWIEQRKQLQKPAPIKPTPHHQSYRRAPDAELSIDDQILQLQRKKQHNEQLSPPHHYHVLKIQGLICTLVQLSLYGSVVLYIELKTKIN